VPNGSNLEERTRKAAKAKAEGVSADVIRRSYRIDPETMREIA
jgi:hypothetical protein